jgi:hypothetical protein
MNTIFPPHTLGFACIPTLPTAGCGPVAPAAGNQGAAPQLLSLPGCVPTHTIATVCTQIGCQPYLSLPGCVPHTMWFICPPVNQAGGPQNTAATVCTQIGCPPPAYGGQAQAQQHISFSPTCAVPANAGYAQAPVQPAAAAHSTSFCTGPMCHAPAQPDAAGTNTGGTITQFNSTQFHSCPPCNVAPAIGQAQNLLSAYTHCPTVSPMCPPANGGQAQTLPYTHLIGCPNTSTCSPTTQADAGQAQPQATFPVTFPPFCPQAAYVGGQAQTLPHTHALGCPNTSTCSPDTMAGGGQAQAQAFTFFGICPPVPTMNCIPSIPGCIVPTLNCQQAQSGASGGAQAQGFPLTSPPMCPPANGGQAQTLPYTHLIGCPNTSTCSPTGQAGGGQAQAQTVFPTILPLCPPPTLGFPCTIIGCNQAQGGAQAQTIFPTTLTPYCTQAANPAGAQAQTIWYTQPGYCSLSTPPLCPTVAICPPANAGQGGAPIVSAATQCPTVPPLCPPTSFNCPPANGGQDGTQAQTLISAYTQCPTVPPMCQPTSPPTCPQPLLSAPPHCPTVAPMCAPANGGGQAQNQAQAFTFLSLCSSTISPVMCIVTKVAGCAS